MTLEYKLYFPISAECCESYYFSGTAEKQNLMKGKANGGTCKGADQSGPSSGASMGNGS